MKNFNCRIDDDLDLKLTLFSVHLGCTKAAAGALAMSAGVPSWVMAVAPSVARRMVNEEALRVEAGLVDLAPARPEHDDNE